MFMSKDFRNKIVNATKWSAFTELLSKIITPIVGLILARLLTPEAFGVVATFTMVISFADIFADAGFHKFIVQHEFKNDINLSQCASVAFWSNQFLSFVIWAFIVIFNEQLSEFVGSQGCGMGLIVACLSIPIIGFSSIQTAVLRRKLDFKALFKVGVVSLLIPLLITIPLAFYCKSYWALVIGTLVKNVINAIILTIYSEWKPTMFFSLKILKNMLSFSLWSMIETFSIWINQYIDVFLVGTILSTYYLGLYKMTMMTVGQILGIVTSIVTPVIFSSLSRLQNDDIAFRQLFYKFQNLVAIIVLPIGAIIFVYHEVITKIIFGEQWLEASFFLGLWGGISAFSIATTRYCNEVYRAKGYPKLCFLSQMLHFVVLTPGVFLSLHFGFKSLCYFRAIVVLELVIVNFIISNNYFHISPISILRNISKPLYFSVIICVISFLCRYISTSFVAQICFMIISLLIYAALIMSDENSRMFVYKYVLRKYDKQ